VASYEVTSPEIRSRVQQIIAEQHYVPNQTVKNLFSGTSNSVAIFIYDMSNPFYISLIQTMNQIAFEEKYTMLICSTANQVKREKEYLDYCLSIRVAGIILTEGFDMIANTTRTKPPLVMFDRSGLGTYPMVDSDNAESVQKAVHYLYNLNHRRIAFAGMAPGLLSIGDRLQGYCTGLEKRGLPVRKEYIFDMAPQVNIEAGVQAMNYFIALPDPPTAVICANDMVAHGLILRAQALHLQIPADLSVIGYDGISSSYFIQQLTTIQQDIPAISRQLFELATRPQARPRICIIPTKFIYGETCQYRADL